MPATQTLADNNGWLVRGITFSIRLFLVFVVAFARAIVVIAGDNYNDNFLDQYFPLDAQTVATPSGWTSASPETHQARTTSTPQYQGSPPSSPVYYVVFIGRDVGYTTSSTVATTLVNGVPNNHSQRFNTLNDAIQAYVLAVRQSNVRRVRPVIRPSGHVEFMHEYVGILAGIRNLDAPHLPSQPLTATNSHLDSQSPIPCKTESGVDLRGSVTTSSVSSVGSTTESNGLIMPVDWSIVNSSEAGADTVIIPIASEVSTLESESPDGQRTPSVVVLDSDEESSNSSDLVNNSAATIRSTHSSDIYYTDEMYDKAFVAYIEEEDRNAGKVDAEALTASVLPE